MRVAATASVLLITCALALPQSSVIQVVPCRTGALPANLPLCDTRPDYMRPLYDALSQGVDVAREAQRLAIERQYLDLAKKADQRAQQQHDLQMGNAPRPGAELSLRNRIMLQRRALNAQFGPALQQADWKINQDVLTAFSTIALRHPDFERLMPAIEVIATGMTADWMKVALDEYLEGLYAVAKYAPFAAAAREALLPPAPDVDEFMRQRRIQTEGLKKPD